MKSSRSNSNFSNNSSGSSQRPNSNFKNFQSNTTAFPSKKSKRSKDSYTEIALEKENYQNSLNKTNNSNRKSLSNIPPISIKSEIRRGSVLPFSSTLQTLNQKYDLNESIISTRTQKDNKNNNILLTERRNTMALSRNDILNRSEILNNSEIELNKNNKKRNENKNNIENKKEININNYGSESSSMSLSTKKLYSKYIKQTLDKEKSISLIDLDIGRTFSSLGVFKNESQLGNNLKEILRIFVVARPDIGYVQGLSYIAGTLLLQMDKFTSFVCFMNIILSPNILPFYRLDENNIKLRLELFNEIFKLNLPELYNHLQENEIFPEHYLLEWFMTLFTRNLKIELALRIWDIYMYEGILSIYKSAIVIFSLNEKKLLNMDFAEIMNFLKNLDKNNYDEDKFVEELNNVKFSEKIINKIHQLSEEYLICE
jgi:hypothetical protein